LHANIQSIDECKIAVSPKHIISLGFPIHEFRLKHIPKPKILVVPFRLKNVEYKFDSSERELFLEAKKNISNFSNGRSEIDFTFNSVIDIPTTAREMAQITLPHLSKKETWQERYAESTWGFVSRFITEQDSKINYSGFDAVILISKSLSVEFTAAEAMIMSKDYNPWHQPMETEEGPINNVAFHYNASVARTVTHEIMHLYGLSDLYGSGFGVPSSLMGSHVIDLLAWEKWVLGWLADENVQCLSGSIKDDRELTTTIFNFDYSKSDQLLVIPTGEKKALVFDLVKRKDRSSVSFYSIDNDVRPPIAAFPSNRFEFSTEISQKQGIGTLIKSPEYSLLITDNDGQNLSLVLIPTNIVNSDAALKLIADANLKEKKTADAQAQARASVIKKKTIICVKGKVTKKITAVKPKCPSDYKIRR
jgi:hypothetical protein